MMRFEDVQVQLIDLPPLSAEYTEPWVYNLIRAADLAFLVLAADEPELLATYVDELLLWTEERHVEFVAERAVDDVDDRSVMRVPARIVLTKCDLNPQAETLLRELPFAGVAVSARSGIGLDWLAQMAFDALRVLRVYTKLPGKKPDFLEPYTLPVGSTVLDVVRMVHREFAERLRYVRIWGSGRFDGQQVPADHRLADRDIVEIHIA